MTSNTISLGHVGLYVNDLERAKAFYCDVVGLSLSDEVPEQGIAFLSGDGRREHHELLLCKSSTLEQRSSQTTRVQQIAFKCHDLGELRQRYDAVVAAGTEIEMVVSHGTAVGVYAFDPEGNRFEVYWDTGVWAKQPFMQDVDLTKPIADLEEDIIAFARAHAEEGYMDPRYRKNAYLDIEGATGVS